MKDIVADYGAIPNNVNFDSGPAFSAAMAAGGRIRVPTGAYYVTGGIVMTRPTILEGDGWGAQIYGMDTTATDLLTIRPDPTFQFYGGWGVRDLYLQPSASQRHGICIDLAVTGVYLHRAIFSNLFLQGGTGNAIYLNNPTNTDGFYCSVIEKCLIIKGGILLPRAGDSLVFRENTINGSGYGIAMSAVPGAVLCSFLDNNIVVTGGPCILGGNAGAVFLVNVARARIERLNAETLGSAAMIRLSGTSAAEIRSCSLNSHGGTVPISIGDGAAMTVIDSNDIQAGGGFPHIVIAPSCPKVAVLGTNRCYDAVGYQVAPVIANQSPPLWNPQPFS